MSNTIQFSNSNYTTKFRTWSHQP